MGIVHKLSRSIFGLRSFTQLLVPGVILVLGVYFFMIPKTLGRPKFRSKRISESTAWIFQEKNAKKEYKTEIFCNAKRIKEKIKSKHPNITCKQHIASNSACELAERLYYTNEDLQTCGYSRPVSLCHYKENAVNPIKTTYTYKCSLKQCRRYHRKNVWVWAVDPKSGQLVQQAYFQNEKIFQTEIAGIIAKTAKNGFDFVLLECTDVKSYKRESHDFTGQLFLFPPPEVIDQRNEEDGININFILLDSVARAHFYRSLPETLSTFNKINSHSKSTAEVLDFELFQSVEGHTAENLHALFTGKLFPKIYTGREREKSPVNVGEFLKHFTENGYATIYQDDLCFDQWWGMRLDLGSPNTWKDFEEKQVENHILNTGLTISSCKLLSINNVTTPFNGPEGPLCFNGKFLVYYWLRHTYLQHSSYSKRQQKLISFTSLNVAHEHKGTRIQSLDSDLARYIRKISTLDKTLTIIFADHGNTYTHYTHAVMEGRFEQFHPSLFMIIPSGVKQVLGSKIMKNLRENQFKLLTLLDIRKALVNVPTGIKSSGVFDYIPSTRTCDDLELRLPNLCVCEGWDVEAKNNTNQLPILHFAVGKINNKIQQYQQEIRSKGHTPQCKILTPTSFYNVRERNKDGYLITSIDFTTYSGDGSTNDHDVFQVQVQSQIDRNIPSRNMKLLNYDRISKYGPYRACADAEVEMRLCVCDLIKDKMVKPIKELVTKEITFEYPKLEDSADVSVVKNSRIMHCLYFRKIAYPEIDSDNKDSIFSINYDVANICNIPLKVTIDVDMENMKASRPQPFEDVVPAFSTLYMLSAIREVPYWDSTVSEEKMRAEPQLN